MIFRIISLLTILVYSSIVFPEAIIHTAPTKEKLTNSQIVKLTNIFTRKTTRWTSTGAKITVFVRPINSIEHKLFVMEWLHITNYRYKKMLQQNTFSGVASNVKTIISDEQMMIIISSTPNSIGYVDDYMVLNNDSNITVITAAD